MHNPNVFEDTGTTNPDIYLGVIKLIKNYSGRILNLGAGQGLLTQELIKQGHTDLYACDKFPEYFQVKGYSCDRCDLNYEVLPYEMNFFDLVICTEVVEHLENPRYLMRQIHRVLKEKGKAIISTPNNLSLRGRLSFFLRGQSSYFKSRRNEEESPHITMLTRFDLLRIFRETGFRLIRIIYIGGFIPKSHIYWQTIFPFLKGELFSDNILFLAQKFPTI